MTNLRSDSFAETRVVDFGSPVRQPAGIGIYEASDPDVQAFARGNDLEKWLELALQLISRHFTSTSAVTLRKQDDPELSDEWINIRVIASGDTDSILDAYDAFTLETASVLPSDVGRKIRLLVGVA